MKSQFQARCFQAMGCPCEILVATPDPAIGAEQLDLAVREAQRIEKKFSRYLHGTIVDRINASQGHPIEVDEETAALLDYAAECYELSGGLFDITTGVLRKAWRFDGTDSTSLSAEAIEKLRDHIGWDKVLWERPYITVPTGFEIDFGGIGKEYAADRILKLLIENHPVDTLVNLGGDIAASGDQPWSVGIEEPGRPGRIRQTIQLRQGALATSGVTKRFIKRNGEILGHILNPKTGWPVKDAPQSVTVAAKTCTEAGLWSTLAMLQGTAAETFLEEQSLEFWCYR